MVSRQPPLAPEPDPHPGSPASSPGRCPPRRPFGRRCRRAVAAGLCLLVVAGAGAGAAAPPDAGAAIPSLADRKPLFSLPQFRLGGRYDLGRPQSFANGGEDGTTLEELGAPPLQLGAITLGTPVRDGDGRIINAVVILGDDWGDATSLYARWVEGRGERGERYPPPVAPGALIDTDRHYVVLLDSLGLFGPATPAAGLGPDFPRYSLFDGVQAGYRLLRDHLNVGEVRLVTGASLGGAAAWAWAALHPEWVGAAMPVAGTPAGDGDDPVARWTLQLMAAAIEADPAWRTSGGRYHALPEAEHPQRGVMFGFSLFDLLTHGLATGPAAAPTDTEAGMEVFAWSPAPAGSSGLARRAASHDAADLLWRIRAAMAFTVTPHLARIRAPLLAIHRADDPWLSAEKTAAAIRRVAGAEMITLPPDGASGRDPLPALAALTADATMQAFRERAGLSGDPRIRAPGLQPEPPRLAAAAAPEPSRSSLPRLTEPFPTRLHEVADAAGRRRPIRIIDVGAGWRPMASREPWTPPTGRRPVRSPICGRCWRISCAARWGSPASPASATVAAPNSASASASIMPIWSPA